jgi:hypothetical protein
MTRSCGGVANGAAKRKQLLLDSVTNQKSRCAVFVCLASRPWTCNGSCVPNIERWVGEAGVSCVTFGPNASRVTNRQKEGRRRD